jgi:hypothetical protein
MLSPQVLFIAVRGNEGVATPTAPVYALRFVYCQRLKNKIKFRKLISKGKNRDMKG